MRKISVMCPSRLTTEELARWHTLQRTVPTLASPFLSPDFAQAVARHRERTRVAVIDEGEGASAFFAFERGPLGVGKPIAPGVSDSQGLIMPDSAQCDMRRLLDACDLTTWEFDHLVSGQEHLADVARRAASPIMELEQGYAAYESVLADTSRRFLRTTLAKERKLEREIGALRFVFDERDPQALDTLMRWKSAQYRRTGRMDRFSKPWIARLVRDLHHNRTTECGGVLSILYAGKRPIAYHYGLRSATVLAGWFPCYDTALAKYSPGLVAHLKLAQAAAESGIRRLDLGKGEAEYKNAMKTNELTVWEGWVRRSTPVAMVRAMRNRTVHTAIRTVTTHPTLRSTARRSLGWYGNLRTRT